MTQNNPLPEKTIRLYKQDPYKVTIEPLDEMGTTLTCFFFRYGANFYAFSYNDNGSRRHVLIDAGDTRYRDRISSILTDNGILPDQIDRIIITHSHHDHYGLADVLAGRSDAEIIAHANFRTFLEGPLTDYQRRWLRGYDRSWLRNCRMQYLEPGDHAATIEGLDFPALGDPIPMGKAGRLEILACPESPMMHTTDQIIVRYSPKGLPHNGENPADTRRPGDDILFSGDLWLMHGPLFSKGFRHFMMHMRFAYFRMKSLFSGKRMPRRDPRIQDAAAKDALKRGFSLIRVMPGHGDEFLGARVIPMSFLADRDLLMELGYPMDADKSILKSKELAPKVEGIRKAAQKAFTKEIRLWKQMGYGDEAIAEMLASIYREQEGGGHLVEDDRKERRERIKRALTRVLEDEAGRDGLGPLAEMTLSKLRDIP